MDTILAELVSDAEALNADRKALDVLIFALSLATINHLTFTNHLQVCALHYKILPCCYMRLASTLLIPQVSWCLLPAPLPLLLQRGKHGMHFCRPGCCCCPPSCQFSHALTLTCTNERQPAALHCVPALAPVHCFLVSLRCFATIKVAHEVQLTA